MTDSKWNDRRVLVTGATGLVGPWLVRKLLDEGTVVVVIVRDDDRHNELSRAGLRDRCQVVSGSVTDEGLVERAVSAHEVDTVFHLAAQALVGPAVRHPIETFESNVRGTWLLLEACRRQRETVRRIVVASSDKAYGTSPILPYTEDMPLRGLHPYDASKSCADIIASTYAHTYGLPVVIGRCGNIFGGGDLHWSRLIPGTIKSFLGRKRPVVRSDGKFRRDYIHVDDVVAAYLALADAADRPDLTGAAFNFGPNAPADVLEVIGTLARLMSCEDLPPMIENNARHEIRDQFLSSAKALNVLHWKPHHTLESGLVATIPWYERYLLGGP